MFFFERLEYIIVFLEKIVKVITTCDHKHKLCGRSCAELTPIVITSTKCVVEVAHTLDPSEPCPRQRTGRTGRDGGPVQLWTVVCDVDICL